MITAVGLLVFTFGNAIPHALADHTPGHTGSAGTGINNNDQQGTGLNNNAQPGTGINTGGSGGGSATSCDGSSSGSITICNPLRADSITDFFFAIIEILLIFAIPLIVFFIIYAGFLMVTAQGSQEQIMQGKRALLYAVIGGLLILGARLILAVIQGTVDSFTV